MKNLKDKINCDCKGLVQCTMYALVLWMGVPYMAVMLGVLYGVVKAFLSKQKSRPSFRTRAAREKSPEPMQVALSE